MSAEKNKWDDRIFKFALTLAVLLLLCALFMPAFAFAGEGLLSWHSPTECKDGSDLSQCPTTAYEIEHSITPSGPFTAVATVIPSVNEYRHVNLIPGMHYWRVLTISNDLKSSPSTVANKNIVSVEPNPPTAVTVE